MLPDFEIEIKYLSRNIFSHTFRNLNILGI